MNDSKKIRNLDIFCSEAKILKQHINLVHNGQKDYKCDSCGKAFSRANSLKIHIISVHNGQKDYKCESCGKSFPQGGNLKNHINAVHNSQKDHKYNVTLVERHFLKQEA